jgi:hypothetical protein
VSTLDRNDLAFWFPPIRDAGLPVPRTEIVSTDVELDHLLDGVEPRGFDEFLHSLQTAVQAIGGGDPVFLRTGHGSGKHSWARTCFLEDPEALAEHVGALVEWSAMAGIFGLPTSTWAVRELIPTAPICRCEAYGGMPVVREFRYFVRVLPSLRTSIEHAQPYWPPAAVEEGHPDVEDWRERLAGISRIGLDWRALADLAHEAARAVGGGFWSVDFLQGADGKWRLTDMADGDDSFRYEVGT